MKVFLTTVCLLGLASGALASERCSLTVTTKETRRFNNQNDARNYCQRFDFSRVNCRVDSRDNYNYDASIDFKEVFRSDRETARESRTEVYRSLFNLLEERRFYSLPSTLGLSFECQSGY